MHEFQLTQVALVGARIAAFHPYGFHSRAELARRRVLPRMPPEGALTELSAQQRQAAYNRQLPVWIHNILSDPDFPQRDELLMPLRRFEGELHDSREDGVVSAVLSAGFRDQHLDPLELPETMPTRQRCSMAMQVGVWQEAYRQLEQDLVSILTTAAADVEHWAGSAGKTSVATGN
jgi:hypothetical protein